MLKKCMREVSEIAGKRFENIPLNLDLAFSMRRAKDFIELQKRDCDDVCDSDFREKQATVYVIEFNFHHGHVVKWSYGCEKERNCAYTSILEYGYDR